MIIDMNILDKSCVQIPYDICTIIKSDHLFDEVQYHTAKPYILHPDVKLDLEYFMFNIYNCRQPTVVLQTVAIEKAQ